MNKFEQVSSDDHQMSLAGGRAGGPRSDFWGYEPCTVRSNASWVMVTWGPHVDRQTGWQTDVYENITVLQLHYPVKHVFKMFPDTILVLWWAVAVLLLLTCVSSVALWWTIKSLCFLACFL